MNSLTSIIFNGADRLKPVLKKLLPQRFLTGIKIKMLNHGYKSLAKKGKQPFAPDRKPDGINIIGLVKAQMGLGQSCRLLANTLEHSSIPYMLYNFELPSALMRSEDHSYDHKISKTLKYNINLIHINPDEMLLMYHRMSKDCWDYCYNIAFWLWELEEIPESWHKYFSMLDEIWTPSEFISRNLRKVTNLPVKTIPYWVTAQTSPVFDRGFFKLPENQFLFLTMYDSNSTMERKNPMGAVNAFKNAFSPLDTHVGLVLKINNARSEDLEILHESLKEYSNVYYITETLEKIAVNSLIKCCDVFVSLHRAEGFGLVMAEAMLVGTPCIATNWSSNTEFMDKNVACMIDYTFTHLKKDCPPYKKGAVWAEPDILQASEYMKQLVDDKKFYKQISDKAYCYISNKLGMKQAVEKIEERLVQIYKKD